MNELIKVQDKDGQQAVCTCKLHKFLESKRQFASRIKDRVEKY